MSKKKSTAKNHRSALKTLAAAAILGLSAQTAYADTLVGFWNFDGSTHLEMIPGSGHTGDWANLANGTIFGSGVTFVEDTQLGSTAAKFTNAGGINVGTFPLITASSPDFTFSGYIQNLENKTNDVIMGNRYPDVGGYNFMKVTSNKLEYLVGSGSHSTEFGLPVGSEWQHIAVTHDGSTLNYYMNGALISSKAMTVDMKAPFKFGLGGDAQNNAEHWTGQMDSFSIYSSAASHADIVLQSRARLSSMTAYWNASDYAEGANWIDRINGKTASITPADLTAGTDKKFEFDRTLNTSESAWYADAAKTTHVYDTTGAWNTTAPTVPTTAWIMSDTVTYAAPTAPTGLYVGGGTSAAALNVTVEQFSGINLTHVMRNGTITTTSGSDFNKTLYIDGGTVNVSKGTFNLTNGGRIVLGPNSNLNTAYMRIGQGNGTAEIVMYGGVINAGSQNIHIGDNGDDAHGILTIYSGLVRTTGSITTGQHKGLGTMNVHGGTVYSGGTMYIAGATYAAGVMNVTGGKVLTNSDFILANNSSNDGAELNVSGGTVISRKNLQIGAHQAAEVNISGGSVFARESASLGSNADGTGTLNLSGGTFATASMGVGLTGKGYVSQTDGKAFVGNLQLGTNRVGDKTAAYELSGGTLSAASITGIGSLAFTGGTLSANSVDGTLNQTSGTLEVQKHPDGLKWTRYNQATSNMDDAIWNNLDSLTPAAEGVGFIGSSAAVPTANNFMVVYDGYIYIPEDGTYKFHINSDDHTRTFIDGKSIGDSSWEGDLTYHTRTASLTKGLHKIDINMRQGSGGQCHNIEIEYPDGQRHEINSQGILFSEDSIDIGQMEIAGDYVMGEEAVLNLDIDLSKGIADQVIIAGDAETSGVLNLIFSGELSQDASFNLFDVVGEANFNFSEINLLNSPYGDSNWILTGLLAGGDGTIHTTGLPEPSTWILMLAGVSGLYLLRKRRNS